MLCELYFSQILLSLKRQQVFWYTYESNKPYSHSSSA